MISTIEEDIRRWLAADKIRKETKTTAYKDVDATPHASTVWSGHDDSEVDVLLSPTTPSLYAAKYSYLHFNQAHSPTEPNPKTLAHMNSIQRSHNASEMRQQRVREKRDLLIVIGYATERLLELRSNP
jgi:hypothetical protein